MVASHLEATRKLCGRRRPCMPTSSVACGDIWRSSPPDRGRWGLGSVAGDVGTIGSSDFVLSFVVSSCGHLSIILPPLPLNSPSSRSLTQGPPATRPPPLSRHSDGDECVSLRSISGRIFLHASVCVSHVEA